MWFMVCMDQQVTSLITCGPGHNQNKSTTPLPRCGMKNSVSRTRHGTVNLCWHWWSMGGLGSIQSLANRSLQSPVCPRCFIKKDRRWIWSRSPWKFTQSQSKILQGKIWCHLDPRVGVAQHHYRGRYHRLHQFMRCSGVRFVSLLSLTPCVAGFGVFLAGQHPLSPPFLLFTRLPPPPSPSSQSDWWLWSIQETVDGSCGPHAALLRGPLHPPHFQRGVGSGGCRLSCQREEERWTSSTVELSARWRSLCRELDHSLGW